MVVLVSYPSQSGLNCNQLQVAMSSLFAQVSARVLTPPSCFLSQAHSGASWTAQVFGTLFSPEDYASAQTLLLSRVGMETFRLIADFPCLSTLTVVPTGQPAIIASCSNTYPALCCAPPPPPLPPTPPPSCNCTTCFDPRTATMLQLQQMQLAISLEILNRTNTSGSGRK